MNPKFKMQNAKVFRVSSKQYVIRNLGGFTLFEVLVSIAILSIAVVTILQLFSANLRNIGKSDEYVKATIKAESIMREILDEELEEGTFSKTTDDGYDVEVSIKNADDDRIKELPLKLLDINMKVKWTDGIKERAISLNTMKIVKRKI